MVRAFFRDATVVFSVVDVLEFCCEVLEFCLVPKFIVFILGMAPVVLLEDVVGVVSVLPLALGFIRGPAEAARDSRSLELFGVAKKG